MFSVDRRSPRTSRLGRTVALAALAASALAGWGLPLARADAATTSSAARAGAADPWAQAVAAAIDYERATATVAAVGAQLASVQTRVTAADQALQEADRELRSARSELTTAIDRMHRQAAVSYRQHGGSIAPVLDIERAQALATATHYAQDATAVDSEEVGRLTRAVDQLTVQRDTYAEALRALQQQQQELTQQRDALTARAQSDQATLDSLGGVPVMGAARLDAPHLAAWFAATGRSPVLRDGTTILDLAQMFIEEGAAERVRGDLAFAQSIIETGYFSQTRGNNYSGIGNCDSCGGRGYGFATERNGVRGQIQLLRNYADPDSRAANLAFPPEPGLYGSDPATAAAKYDRFFLKGRVPLWNLMGHGNWATDPTYAGKVLTVYQRMLEFAAAHP